MGVKKGDTPESNPISKEVLGWIDELLLLLGSKPKASRVRAKNAHTENLTK